MIALHASNISIDQDLRGRKMSGEKNVQVLLRLLTGGARVPLVDALPKVKLLLAAGLATLVFPTLLTMIVIPSFC
jgi:hypothetical protein